MTPRIRRLTLLVLPTLVALAAAAPSRAAECTDAAVLAASRQRIESACPCASAIAVPSYRSCVRAEVTSIIAGGFAPAACARQAMRCAMRSTCGGVGAVLCCRAARSEGRRCRVTTADACLAHGGCVSPSASCCDACTVNGGCATTTTTATPSTTTLPSLCGNGMIDAGEQCDGGAFCESDCRIVLTACCERSLDGGTCATSVYPGFSAVGLCGAIGGTQVIRGTTPSGTNPCSGAAGFSSGACGPPITFPPTRFCCRPGEPGTCTEFEVSDSTTLDDYLVLHPLCTTNGLSSYAVGRCVPTGPANLAVCTPGG